MSLKIFLLAFLLASAFSLEGITDLTDSNFEQTLTNNDSIWLVLFSADWCGHCQALKPELEKLAPRLQNVGVKIGHVNEKENRKLINDHVVDHQTHMVSYPKLKVFLGSEVLGSVPSGLRNADQIYSWFLKEYNLSENGEQL